MDIQKLQSLLIRHEGLKLKPYRDTVGKLTIGVGRNLDDVGISKVEAMAMLNADIIEKSRQLQAAIPWIDRLSEVRQMALVSMAFMGIGRLMEFKKMIAALERGDYAVASAEMLDSTWAKQVGSRAVELSTMILTDTHL